MYDDVDKKNGMNKTRKNFFKLFKTTKKWNNFESAFIFE